MRSALAVGLLLSTGAAAQVTKTTVMVPFANCNPSPALVNYPVDVYRPGGAGPFALVGIAHGFQNGKDNHEVVARELAGRGMVVVVPQFPLLIALQCGYSDHSRNANILIAAIDQQVMAGDIDPQRIGVAGHSAGGLSAFLAASRRPYAAVVLLDAVENGTLGTMQVANVSEPTLMLSAESSQCNAQNNSAPWFAALTGLKANLRVVGASHCEPQDPLNATCTGTCGGTTSAARQALFRKYTVAFFERFLTGVTMPCFETLVAADEQAGSLSMVDVRLGTCAAPVDAGVPDAGAPDAGGVDAGGDAGGTDAGFDAGAVLDAGPEDAGTDDAGTNRPAVDAGLADAGSTSDAGVSVDGGVDGPEAPKGCGCSSGFSAFALLALVLLRRRR